MKIDADSHAPGWLDLTTTDENSTAAIYVRVVVTNQYGVQTFKEERADILSMECKSNTEASEILTEYIQKARRL